MKDLRRKPILIITLVLLGTAIFDFVNLDRITYKLICYIASFAFTVTCPDYYDLPIWEVAVSFGSLAALYFAYKAIIQSNKQLEAEQTPYVVMKGHVGMADNNKRMHIVSFENIGKGLAANITLTADPTGKISIIDGSNAHTENLGCGQHNTGWAIDEARVIEGLIFQNRIISSSVIDGIPDENVVKNKSDSDFYLYFWYQDQTGQRYKTETKIRHSGSFLKVMENVVTKL